MSTGLNCEIIEAAPDEWYYLLEDCDAPADSWDWRENATAYGPFPTTDAALDHVSAYHGNPGGYSVQPYEPGLELDDLVVQLLEQAPTRLRNCR